jgi:hypothetical protein
MYLMCVHGELVGFGMRLSEREASIGLDATGTPFSFRMKPSRSPSPRKSLLWWNCDMNIDDDEVARRRGRDGGLNLLRVLIS